MKRLLDIALASACLVLSLPLLVLIASLVRVKLGAPILFRQRRPGLHGKIFTMYKFKTMTDARDPSGQLLPDAQRLTPFGRFLRSTSLDELPELINVLKGDMSLVGPRPLLIEYLPYYSERERKRHLVRPGITGLAQVRGRHRLPWDERLELDVQYVERWSLLLDMRIILESVAKVISRSDILDAAPQGSLAKHRQHMRPAIGRE
jgi:sugar transferase EpsL